MFQEFPTSNFSNAQPQTSYPSGPSRDNPPRHLIIGGYVLDNTTVVNWGSRFANRHLDPAVENDSLAALFHIKKIFAGNRYGMDFIMVGEECFTEYMVMTQSKRFSGWEGMDPKLIPQFKEGELEAMCRKFLEQEGGFTCFYIPLWKFKNCFVGINDYEFRTMLY
jgi:hypothetical protein